MPAPREHQAEAQSALAQVYRILLNAAARAETQEQTAQQPGDVDPAERRPNTPTAR